MDFLKDFAVKVLNLTDEQFAETVYSDVEKQTLKEDALQQLLNKDAERIKAAKAIAKERETELHDKGYKKAQAESLSKFEKEIKEQFQVPDSTSQGVDLIKEIIAKISKDTNLDDDKVKLHPLYVSLEKQMKEKYIGKEEYDKVVSEFDGFKKNVDRDKVMHFVKADALKIFRSLKPVLPSDAIKATNQENKFLAEFDGYEYQVQNDGSHIILVDGKRLENAQGHPISFADFVKGRADMYFEFEQQSGKGNAGNSGGGAGSGGQITLPTDVKKFNEMLALEPDPQKQIAMSKAWDEAHK